MWVPWGGGERAESWGGSSEARVGWGGRLSPDTYSSGPACHLFQWPGLQTPGKMNPSCPGSDQEGDMEEGQLDGHSVSISSF